MKAEDERTKLFNEIWSEPMTTVAQRYGLSDNGLRKRCIKFGIPLPPMGYWAKLKAGQKVTPKPILPTIKVKLPTIILKDAKQEREIEFIDIGSQSTETLKTFDGMGVLTRQSQEEFAKWCRKVKVCKKVDSYHPLIIEYQKEVEYRKVRDKEHKFRDIFRFHNVPIHPKIEYRADNLVLPISVSDNQSNRTFRIIDTLIKAVEELDGKVTVEKHFHPTEAKDNATISVFKDSFSFQIKEMMAKRRAVIANTPVEKIAREFRPMYEKVFIGILEMEFRQKLHYWEKEKEERVFTFKDSTELSLEDQLGEIIKTLFKTAQESKITQIIADREEEIREEERACLQEIEAEKEKRQQEIIMREKRQKQLVNNIEQQMDDWYKTQKLRQYVQTLEVHVASTADEVEKKSLVKYIDLVRKKADNCDPIGKIIEEIKSIGLEET